MNIPSEESWYEYLLRGFETLGCRVTLTASNTVASKRIPLSPGFPKSVTITNFDIQFPGQKPRTVWYDWSDFKEGFSPEFMQPNDLYFKIQFHKDFLKFKNVFPIGQTITKMDYFRYVDELRAAAHGTPRKWDIVSVLRSTNVDGRVKMVEALRKTNYKILSGITERSCNKLSFPQSLAMDKLDYIQHLKEQSLSKIAVALYGVGGDWVWRHTEILGMGICLLTLESDYLMPGNPVNCWIEVKRDLSNLQEKLYEYINNDKKREEVAMNGRCYFEKFLSPAAQAKYILEKAEAL
jgi:hypothetical protein